MKVNGDSLNGLPGTLNLTFEGASGESLMNLLDMKGVCVSTSSACTAADGAPSHVLIAMGLTEQQAKSSIRISYGKFNSANEVERVVRAVCDSYAKIVENATIGGTD